MKHLGSTVSRHPLISNFKQVDRKIELVENTYNNSLLEKSLPDEVVQARGKFPTLGDRLQYTDGFSHQLYTLKNARITYDDQSDTYKFLCEKVVAKINGNTLDFVNIEVDILNPEISEQLLATKSEFFPEPPEGEVSTDTLGAVSFLVSLGDDGVYIDRAAFVEQEHDMLFSGNIFGREKYSIHPGFSGMLKKPHVPTSEETQDNLFLAIGVMNIGDVYKANSQADSSNNSDDTTGEMVGVMRESDFFIAQPNVFSYGTLVNKSRYFLHFKHAIRHCQQNSQSFHYTNVVDVFPCAFLHEETRQITDLRNTVINAGHMLFGSNANKNYSVKSADIADVEALDNLFARLTNVTINDLRIGFVIAYAVTDFKLHVASFKPPIELQEVDGLEAVRFKNLPVISLQDANSGQSHGTVHCETLLPVKMMLVKETDAYQRVDNWETFSSHGVVQLGNTTELPAFAAKHRLIGAYLKTPYTIETDIVFGEDKNYTFRLPINPSFPTDKSIEKVRLYHSETSYLDFTPSSSPLAVLSKEEKYKTKTETRREVYHPNVYQPEDYGSWSTPTYSYTVAKKIELNLSFVNDYYFFYQNYSSDWESSIKYIGFTLSADYSESPAPRPLNEIIRSFSTWIPEVTSRKKSRIQTKKTHTLVSSYSPITISKMIIYFNQF